jgi:MFS family permease
MSTTDPYRALRVRDFRLLFLAGTLSVVGAFLESVALSWELYERTGDPLVLGTVGLIEFLPVLLFALPAGHVADRFDRRTVAVVMRLLEACAAAGLAVLSWTQGSVPLIYAVLFVTSMARTFQGPASGALLPLIVPGAAFSNAVAWQTTAMQLAGMVAPALVGGMIAVFAPVRIEGGPLNVGATAAYAISAVLSLVIAVCLWQLRVRETAKRREAATLADVLAGVRFVFRERLILAAITLDLFAVLFGGAVALLPVFAKDVLNVGPQGFGLLRAAPAIGAVIMAVALTRMPPIRRAGRTLLWVVAGFGVATIVFGLSQNFVLSLVALALTGAFDNVSMVIRGSLVPMLTPDAMRGRVAAVERVFISSSNELGALESGIAARAFGAVPAVIFGGVGTLIVVALVGLLSPQLRQLGSVEEIQPAASTETPAGAGH